MIHIDRLLGCALLLSLAGCGQPAPAPSDPDTNEASVAETNAVAQNDAMPANAASEALVLPAAIQGRWGLVAADCEPGRDDAKGLMTIEGGSVKFYESRGTVTKLSVMSPEALSAEVDYTGEGQEWDRVTAFTLLDEGKTLLREERDPALALRYQRCPA